MAVLMIVLFPLVSSLLIYRCSLLKPNNCLLQFFSSQFWLYIMVLPILAVGHLQSPQAYSAQLYSSIFIYVVLLTGDWLCFLKAPGVLISLSARKMSRHELLFFIGVFLLVVLVQVSHLLAMDKIPLFEVLTHSTDKWKELRQKTNHEISIPRWILYLANLTMFYFTPLLVAVLWGKGRKALASCIFVFTALYSVAFLHKSLVLFIVLLSALAIGSLYFTFIGAQIKKLAGVSIVLLVALLIMLNFESKNIPISCPESKSCGSLADKYRENLFVNELYANNKVSYYLNYIIYRVVLVPSEVSGNWYRLFGELKGPLGFYGITPESRHSPDFVHPANQVGVWAYKQKFPELYLASNHSYSSVDANAYSRWKAFGVFVVGLLLFLLRVGMALPVIPQIEWFAISNVTILLFGLLLPISSIHSILVAQCFSLIIVTRMLYWVVFVRVPRRTINE